MKLTDEELKDLYTLRNVKTKRRHYQTFESLNGKIGKFRISGTFILLNEKGEYVEKTIPAYFLAYNCGTGENINVSLIDKTPYLDIERVGDYLIAKDEEDVVFNLEGKRVEQNVKAIMGYVASKKASQVKDCDEDEMIK